MLYAGDLPFDSFCADLKNIYIWMFTLWITGERIHLSPSQPDLSLWKDYPLQGSLLSIPFILL